MNHSKTSLIYKLLDHYADKFNITDRETGTQINGYDLWRVAVDIHPRLEEYVKIYNECVELIYRLSPTMNTTFHILLQREFKKPLHLIKTKDLYRVKDILLSKL